MKREEVKVTVENGVLSISGERKYEKEELSSPLQQRQQAGALQSLRVARGRGRSSARQRMECGSLLPLWERRTKPAELRKSAERSRPRRARVLPCSVESTCLTKAAIHHGKPALRPGELLIQSFFAIMRAIHEPRFGIHRVFPPAKNPSDFTCGAHGRDRFQACCLGAGVSDRAH